jgi:general nucleoside transport system permease protein
VDTAGVSVVRMRYYGVGLSGILAALGGVYLSMGQLSAFTEGMTGGRGFIALTALIFGRWNPIGALALPLLFGFAQATTFGVGLEAVPIEFVEMFPYLLTIIASPPSAGAPLPPPPSASPTARSRLATRRIGRASISARVVPGPLEPDLSVLGALLLLGSVFRRLLF